MKARELLNEGGNAFPDVGAIHISEVQPTLQSLAKKMGAREIVDQVLGSVGKAEYSGDIDIAIDADAETMKKISHDLRNKLGNQNVTGVAGNVTLRVPITNYDKTKQGRKPRTGFVQVDLIPGKPDWMKTFYHSPGDTSKLKGVHRNMALTSLAKNINTSQTSKELDDAGRPVDAIRWSWGPKGGLQKVRKTSKKNAKTGAWTKKQDTEVLSEPLTDVAKIAHIMFRGKAGPEALNSVETILDAVKKAYNKEEQEAIYKEIARMYRENEIVEGFPMPPEVEKYL